MLKIKILQAVLAGLTFLLGLLSNLVLRLQKQSQKPQKQQKLHHIKSELDSSSSSSSEMMVVDDDERYGLTWRLAMETNNNVRPWKTIPLHCYKHVENYMIGGQYEHDMNLIVDELCFMHLRLLFLLLLLLLIKMLGFWTWTTLVSLIFLIIKLSDLGMFLSFFRIFLLYVRLGAHNLNFFFFMI